MQLPSKIQSIIESLQKNKYEAYAVGGCVRDLFLDKKPNDWDITTNAKPEEIQSIFPESFYENAFGTVTVRIGSEDPSLKEVQITPYRTESKYTDKRHPDEIKFAKTLEEDLSRRDFTINAIAMAEDGQIIDPFNGKEDVERKIIRTVGKPEERFSEDALRLLRAVRFAAALGFEIEKETIETIHKNAQWLQAISKERIRDELVKIVMSNHAYEGMLLLHQSGLLQYILPETEEGIGVSQNLHHIYDVWEHCTRALKYASEKDYPLEVRLASLFHDIGKPRSKRGEGTYSTFYGHEVIGARMVAKIMERLKFSKDTAEKVIGLVRYHMFYYTPDEVTESSVRRLLVKIGKENVEDLLKVREADRIGSGRPKAVPYKLRHLKYIIDKVSHDPISPKMLKVNGQDVMKELNIEPGPKVGLILNSLLAEVIDDPSKNSREYLIQRVHELNSYSPEELRGSIEKIEKAMEEEEKQRMEKYHV
ncbi:MAG TPA: HD domain-containing protein [Candidatus Paceibacterota bacterium]